MTFNKWFPGRVETRPPALTQAGRAWALRGAWYTSTAMLVVGYVLLAIVVTR